MSSDLQGNLRPLGSVNLLNETPPFVVGRGSVNKRPAVGFPDGSGIYEESDGDNLCVETTGVKRARIDANGLNLGTGSMTCGVMSSSTLSVTNFTCSGTASFTQTSTTPAVSVLGNLYAGSANIQSGGLVNTGVYNGGTNAMTTGIVNCTSMLAGGATNSAFSIDGERVSTSIVAKLGSILPIYIASNPPGIAFNLYYDGTNWRFGKGSSAQYGWLLQISNTTSGILQLFRTTAAGNADAVATLASVWFHSAATNNMSVQGQTIFMANTGGVQFNTALSGLSIRSNNSISFINGDTGGIFLPNVGSAVQSSFNYYEELSFSLTFQSSGGGGVPAAVTVTGQRIGKLVSLCIPMFGITTGGAANEIWSTTTISTYLRPVTKAQLNLTYTRSNGVGSATSGYVYVSTSGTVIIGYQISNGNFPAGFANSGLATNAVVTYTINN